MHAILRGPWTVRVAGSRGQAWGLVKPGAVLIPGCPSRDHNACIARASYHRA